MCGIAGFIKFKNNSDGLNETSLKIMVSQLSHRGPDFKDYWIRRNIFFGHTRLSIIDISKNGNQPMLSHSGRFVLVFNGEIYNFKNLKKEIENQKKNVKWRGNSDTEVFLECIEFWGLRKTLNKSRGMFAFAIWDQKEKKITVARDRIGEKPLYFSQLNNSFVFSSELKAIKSVLNNFLVNHENAMNMMMRFGYIPAPYTIYKNVFKLLPGTFISVDKSNQIIDKVKWFDLSEEIDRSKNMSKEYDEENLHNVLRLSVKEQLNSDVPIGCLLSGGVDSSLITAVMQEQSSQKINTFTIGFDEDQYDEAKYARNISKMLNTNHHELYVKPQMAMDIIPDLSTIYDEPFGDSSQIPTILVSKLASKSVKVCLSGDGGDELFGGYNRYLWSNTIFNLFKYVPYLKNIFKITSSQLSPDNWNKIYKIISYFISNNLKVNNFGDKLYKISEIMNFENKVDLYIQLISQWRSNLPTNNQFNEIEFFKKKISWSENLTYFENLMRTDTLTYLPDDILVKVDRASMSCSLETRAPFLDVRLIQAAWKIPSRNKIKNKIGKLPLKRILNKYLPDNLINRPKQGFALPIDTWLRTSLKDWAEELLQKKKLEENQYYDSKLIRKIWKEHLTEERNWQYPIWNILMLQSWIENQK